MNPKAVLRSTAPTTLPAACRARTAANTTDRDWPRALPAWAGVASGVAVIEACRSRQSRAGIGVAILVASGGCRKAKLCETRGQASSLPDSACRLGLPNSQRQARCLPTDALLRLSPDAVGSAAGRFRRRSTNRPGPGCPTRSTTRSTATRSTTAISTSWCLADELGFDGVCVNEHHQNAYGTMPSPNLMGAILARQTKRVKIAVIGNALPLYNPPTRVAEEFAMIDVISGGRLIAGLVVGGGPEYYSFSMNPTHARGMFQEGDGPGAAGLDRAGAVRALRRILEAEVRQPLAAADPAAAPDRSGFPAPAARRRSSSSPPAASATWAFRISTSTSSSATSTCSARPPRRAATKPAPISSAGSARSTSPRPTSRPGPSTRSTCSTSPSNCSKGLVVLPPGYTSVRSIAGIHTALSKFLSTVETRKQVEDGAYAIVGSPATVRDKLLEYGKRLGVGNLLGLFQLGTLPADLTRKNMQLFAREVMPALQAVKHAPLPQLVS